MTTRNFFPIIESLVPTGRFSNEAYRLVKQIFALVLTVDHFIGKYNDLLLKSWAHLPPMDSVTSYIGVTFCFVLYLQNRRVR